jgi:hypothetical protein
VACAARSRNSSTPQQLQTATAPRNGNSKPQQLDAATARRRLRQSSPDDRRPRPFDAAAARRRNSSMPHQPKTAAAPCSEFGEVQNSFEILARREVWIAQSSVSKQSRLLPQPLGTPPSPPSPPNKIFSCWPNPRIKVADPNEGEHPRQAGLAMHRRVLLLAANCKICAPKH